MKLLFWIGFAAMTIFILFSLSKKLRYCEDCGSAIPIDEVIIGLDGYDYCKQCYKINFCKSREDEG